MTLEPDVQPPQSDSEVPDQKLPLELLLIIAAGAIFRLARLGSLPPAIFRDEAEKAYTAFSLLKTGRTVSGDLFPLFVNVYGVTTSMIYQYLTLPCIALLGLNEWSARLPASLAGIATIVATYFLVKQERGKEAALWAAAFLAFSPWHIPFSRWAQQGILVPLLLTIAMIGFHRFRDGKPGWLLVSSLASAIAIYTYDVCRLFVPLLLLWIGILYWAELRRAWRWIVASALLFLAALAPVIHLAVTAPASAQARFRAISIFRPGDTLIDIVRSFASNYFAHWSPQFLMLRGDPELRHGAGVGVLTTLELICVLFAVIVFLRRRKKTDLLWLGWLALFPVAASLTRVGIPHALRSIVAIPAFQIAAGIGAFEIVHRFPIRLKKRVQQLGALTLVLSFAPFASLYFIKYSSRSALNWQYGVQQSLGILSQYEQQIDRIVFYNVTGAEYLTAFYKQLLPAQLQREGLAGTRYSSAPFNAPLAGLYAANSAEGVAYISYPFYAPPPNGKTIPIFPPGTEESPVQVIYLNETLARRLAQRP